MSKPLQCVLILLLSGAIGRAGITAETAGMQERQAKLKAAWKREAEKHRNSFKSFYFFQVAILKQLLTNSPTDLVESEFQRICAKEIPPVPLDPTDLEKSYDNVVLEAFVQWSIEQRDARKLSTLLVNNCPCYIVHAPLEFCLAYDWPGSITLLFECYARSKSSLARKDMVLCLRRAFASWNDRLPGDDAFLKAVRTWYDENRPSVKVNMKYPFLPSQPMREKSDPADLFVLQ